MRYNMTTGMKFDLQKMGLKAHDKGFYATESEEAENPILYVANDDEIALINRGGAIRLTLQDALAIAGELMDILNDYQSFVKERRRFA
jgi:hypothetical protein